MNREVKKFVRRIQCDRPGWYFGGYTGTGHVKLNYTPGGTVIVASTPSDHLWQANTEAKIKRLEKESGPYVPELNINKRKDFGLSLSELIAKNEETKNETLSSGELPSYRPPVAHTTTMVEKEPVKAFPRLSPIPTKPQTKENYAMSIDREIILRVLQEKYNELRPKLEPYLELFEEYSQIEKALNNIKRADKPTAEKVEEYLKNKNVTKNREVMVSAANVTNIELYEAVEEIVKSHGGKMPIQEIIDWLTEVKGYTFILYGLSPRTSLLRRLRKKKNGSLSFGPPHVEGAGSKPHYKYIEYTDEVNLSAMIKHHSNANV
jgi:hypothetical protein